MEDEEEKRRFITNYFSSLFRADAEVNSGHLLQSVVRKVTVEMNELLTSEFSAVEVKEALDSIGDLKAPCPDGMPSIFYKKFWEVVGERVTAEVLSVLNGGPFPEGWNETKIVLIPKVQKPERIKDLQTN